MDFDDLMNQGNAARITELETLIQRARQDYENGTPTVSDDVFDAWVAELKELKPESSAVTAIGAPLPAVTEWAKAAHGFTMGSLDKVNTPAEMSLWLAGVGVKEPVLVTQKLDGISIHLRYEDGVLVQAITRGDGTTGEDIVRNVSRMKGIPKTVVHYSVLGSRQPFTGSIRGEIILLKSDHRKHFPDYANPRNAASGISKRFDGTGSEHLTVMVYQIVDGDVSPHTEYDQFGLLRSWGFKTPHWNVHIPGQEGSKGPNDYWQLYQDGGREQLDYDIDGLVVRVNDLTKQHSLGEKDGRPKGAVAFKFAAEGKLTTITRIDWQVGGQGRITPVAIFEPVNVMGATITNASAYNLKYIAEKGIGVGAEVMIIRANDVIPRVAEVTKPPVKVEEGPRACPACGAETEMEGEYLICPDVAGCPAQAVGRIKRYLSVLDVKEWGDVFLEKLVEGGHAKSVLDLYKLTPAVLATIDRMGEKSAAKVYKTLWDKNHIPMETLLGGMSIPGCGSSTILLAMDAGFDTLDAIYAARREQFEAVPGIGPVKADALFTWLHEASNWATLDAMQTLGVKIRGRVKGKLTGKSFCFTGSSTKPRKELEKLVTDNGGVVKSSAGKGCTYLVMADPNSTSTKAQAARKAGVTCISETDFLAMAE